MSFADKMKAFAADPRAQKAGSLYKKAETGIWRALDPIGQGANRLAGRAGAESFWPTELAEGELDKAARILRTFTLDAAASEKEAEVAPTQLLSEMQEQQQQTAGTSSQSAAPSLAQTTTAGSDSKDQYAARKTQKTMLKIPPEALRNASGVAIMTCFRTGFGLSGSSGSGVVLAKLPDGSWGPPSGILVHTIGWGFLIGLDIYDVVIILRTPEALHAFERAKISVGGELSVAAGPVGNGAMLDAGLERAPCWSYTKSKGAYAGIQLDGTVILNRDDANARFYGRPVHVSDILAGRNVHGPQDAMRPLWQTLYAAEGRPDVMGTEKIPEGVAPGETSISTDEAKELEALNKDTGSNPPTAAAPAAPVSGPTSSAV